MDDSDTDYIARILRGLELSIQVLERAEKVARQQGEERRKAIARFTEYADGLRRKLKEVS